MDERERQLWSELLFQIFRDCRLAPAWNELKALHDDEDREHFAMLEELYLGGKISL